MTDTTSAFSDVTPFDELLLSQGVSHAAILCAVILGIGTMAAGWLIVPSSAPRFYFPDPVVAPKIVFVNPYGELAGGPRLFGSSPVLIRPGSAPRMARRPAPASSRLASAEPAELPSATGPAAAAMATVLPPPRPPAAALAPARVAPSPPMATARSAPAERPATRLTESLPTPSHHPQFRPPARHPSASSSERRVAQQTSTAEPSSAAPDNRNFFEKLLDMPQRPSGPELAYANPEDDSIGRAPPWGQPQSPVPGNRYTAVYDIAAHTVYMPDGEKLEAHSGLGNFLDDPHHVNAKNRGATPPHAYALELRKQLFHGVRALRLDPVGSGTMYGRTGLLAHTYMLGPKGASNGCVSFRDYSTFLHAFMSGEVKWLVVVTHHGRTQEAFR